MLLQIDNKLYTQLDDEIQKKHYNARRYNFEYTFALLYTPSQDIKEKDIKNLIRLSDFLLKLNDNYYFIVFNYTNEQAAFKASENLIYKLNLLTNNEENYIAIDRAETTDTTKMVFNRLYQILEFARKEKREKVADETILNDQI